jgi:hypothetical protein
MKDSITNFSVLSAKIIVEKFKLHSYKRDEILYKKEVNSLPNIAI